MKQLMLTHLISMGWLAHAFLVEGLPDIEIPIFCTVVFVDKLLLLFLMITFIKSLVVRETYSCFD